MTNQRERSGENYEETRTRTETEKIAPEKQSVGGDLKDAVSTIMNDDGRMKTEFNEEDYDRTHPDKA